MSNDQSKESIQEHIRVYLMVFGALAVLTVITVLASFIEVSTSEGIHDEPGINTQNKDSIFGKILFIPINEPNNIEIYSMGHRVIQGLSVNDGIVIEDKRNKN